MAENTVKARLQHAYKDESSWNSSNPVLKNGEVGYVGGSPESPNYGRYKIGDGVSQWKDLEWGDKGILPNLYSIRSTTANLDHNGNGGLSTFKATSSMDTGKPDHDGHILHFYWDNNTDGYDSQLFVPINASSQNNSMQYRGKDVDGWGNWKTILDDSNYTTYVPTKSGEGASGTWNINITGSAATLTTPRKINDTDFDGSADITTSKWGLSRTITAAGDFDGSYSIDGSGNVSYELYNYHSIATVGNQNNYAYHRIAKLDQITEGYRDRTSLLYISQDFNDGGFGIIRISLRTNGSGAVSSVEARWLVRSRLNTDSVQIGIYNVSGNTYADVYFKCPTAYGSTTIRAMASGNRGNINRTWILVESMEAMDTTSTDKKNSYECWASVNDAATELHAQAYSGIVAASDDSVVNSANTSTKVANSLSINGKSFDGSSAVNVGTIGISYGGTGAATAANARINLGAMGSVTVDGYEGIARSNGNTSDWIRSTVNGFIPYQSGDSSNGHSSIGTSTWYFANAYIQNIFGSLMRCSGEIQSTATNAFRAIRGKYGFIIRNDGDSTYFLLTNENDAYGTFNNYRPIAINNSNGKIAFGTAIDLNNNCLNIKSYGQGVTWAQSWGVAGINALSSGATLNLFSSKTGVSGWYDSIALVNSDGSIGIASKNHTHSYLPLSGGVLTGPLAAKTPSGGDASFVIVTYSNDNYIVNRIWCSASSTLTINGRWNSTRNSNKTITVSSSDIRLKENIVDSSVSALPIINQMKLREFDWKDHVEHQKIGFVADELQLIDSRLAIGGGYDENGIMNEKAVDTFYLMGYAIKGMQEICEIDDMQNTEIESLKNENKSLRNKIILLEQRLEKLEGGV